MNSSKKKPDDLTVIKGIGPARQKWLRESLDVITFADLAARSVAEIEARLKADNQIASQSTIETWIAQAREHAEAARAAETVEAVTGEQENYPAAGANDSAEGNDGGPAPAKKRKDGWTPFASFVVEFQERGVAGQALEFRTTVHHIEADSGTNWPGIEREKHCSWMLEQVQDRVSAAAEADQPPAAEPAEAPVPAARAPVKLQISGVRAFQPPQAEKPVGGGQNGQPFEGRIRAHQPFALQMRFDLKGDGAAELTETPARCQARFYIQDESTGESIHLGDAQPARLAKGQLTYTVTLSEATSVPGSFRLFALVTLGVASVTPDFVTVPSFRVVE